MWTREAHQQWISPLHWGRINRSRVLKAYIPNGELSFRWVHQSFVLFLDHRLKYRFFISDQILAADNVDTNCYYFSFACKNTNKCHIENDSTLLTDPPLSCEWSRYCCLSIRGVWNQCSVRSGHFQDVVTMVTDTEIILRLQKNKDAWTWCFITSVWSELDLFHSVLPFLRTTPWLCLLKITWLLFLTVCFNTLCDCDTSQSKLSR